MRTWTDDIGTLLFAGVIDKPRRTHKGNVIYHSLSCIDWHYYADKRRYAGAFENQSAGSIVRTILTNKLSEEGITEGFIQDGPQITEARFNYAKVSDCFDSIAEKANYWWMIDKHKQLHFVAKHTYDAPFTVSNSEMEKGSISLEIGNPKYRNRQYVTGGKAITDPQTETIPGNGESRSFLVGFPIAKVPTVEVNGITKTVGIRGVQEGKEFYWSKGSNVISQENSHTPLATTDRLQITYQGEFDIVALSELPEEIAERKEIEGGTGIVETVDDDRNITNQESAFQLANAKLDKYGTIGRRVRFKTWLSGLESGHILKVTIPQYNLNNTEMLIESISIQKKDNVHWYNVTCVEGPINGSWTKLFYEMATKNNRHIIQENIREDQVLVLLTTFERTWLETDGPNIFKVVYPSETLLPGVYPTFETKDRVKYVAWFNQTNELGRKAITKQSYNVDGSLSSTVYLSPLEANTTITHIGWIGGQKNNVIVDKQEYARTKTNLEAIQIDKKDIKGW